MVAAPTSFASKHINAYVTIAGIYVLCVIFYFYKFKPGRVFLVFIALIVVCIFYTIPFLMQYKCIGLVP